MGHSGYYKGPCTLVPRTSGAPAAGIDGTDGEHPRFTTVVGNVVREVRDWIESTTSYGICI